MISVLSCTNRKNSKTLILAEQLVEIYKELQQSPLLMDLQSIPLSSIKEPYACASQPKEVQILHKSQGIVLVIPEYNNSIPGIFKYFLDHWSEKKTISYRPFCLIGIGSGSSEGRQALQHITDILSAQRAYIYPKYVCVQSEHIPIRSKINKPRFTKTKRQPGSQAEFTDSVSDQNLIQLLKTQASGFVQFIEKADHQ